MYMAVACNNQDNLQLRCEKTADGCEEILEVGIDMAVITWHMHRMPSEGNQ